MVKIKTKESKIFLAAAQRHAHRMLLFIIRQVAFVSFLLLIFGLFRFFLLFSACRCKAVLQMCLKNYVQFWFFRKFLLADLDFFKLFFKIVAFFIIHIELFYFLFDAFTPCRYKVVLVFLDNFALFQKFGEVLWANYFSLCNFEFFWMLPTPRLLVCKTIVLLVLFLKSMKGFNFNET